MFNFKQTPGVTKITFNGSEILRFTQEHLCFRGFRIENVRLKPNGPVEFINLHTSCFYNSANYLRAKIDCDLKSEHEIEIAISPLKVDNALDKKIHETRIINIKIDTKTQRFIYTIKVYLEFKKDIYSGEPGFYFDPMPQWEDDDYAIVEIEDTLLSGGKGPQVPMTQDWTGIQEPWFHEQCFTEKWEKRYSSVTINTEVCGIRKIKFNRSVNSVQQFYNRHVLKALPRTPFIYEKTDGKFVEFMPDFDAPIGHHICEWGYDMHMYALLPKADKDKELYFQKGSTLDFSYQLQERDRNEISDNYLSAEIAGMEPEERLLADMAIYEEPVCLFLKSGIESPDASRWTPGNEQCVWNRTGWKDGDAGALEINNGDKSQESKWIYNCLGPSPGCNPIPPKSKFKISAWIKADELELVKLIHTLNSYYGPGMYAIGRKQTVSLGTSEDIKSKDGDFHFIEFISEESGPYCLDGSFEFEYSGKGSACMSLLAIERM